MKKKIQLLMTSVISSISISASMFASAAEPTPSTRFQPKDIFQGNDRSELFLSVTQAEINAGSGTSEVNIGGMYAYLAQENLQFGAQVALGTVTAGGETRTKTDIFGLGIYNFSPELYNSYFGFAGLGVGTIFTKSGSESKSGVRLGGGRRFPILTRVQYVPMAWVEKIGAFDPVVSLVPVNFSIIF